MIEFIKKLIAPPVFEDEDKTRVARYFNAIALSTIGVLILALTIRFTSGATLSGTVSTVLLALLGLFLVTRLIMKKGYVSLAANIVIGLAWAGLLYLAGDADGVHDITFVALIIPILMASLLLGTRAMIIYLAASILAGFGLAYLETTNIIQPRLDTPQNFARDSAYILALVGTFIYLITSSLNNALAQSRETASEFERSNIELRSLQNELEKRVEDRTAELEQTNLQLSRRAKQFESIAQISRVINTIQNPEELLPRITKMISQLFGFYHVGIFLLDENNEYAVLRAANSEGGQRMLTRNHRLQVGGIGIVGYVTKTGIPRIALDVGADAVYFDNPDLPDTHSEMTLPLRIGQTIVGALDVQSIQPNAFAQEDISILSVLADQVSAAVYNARLFEESRDALAGAESTYRQLTGQAWAKLKKQAPVLAYRFDGIRPQPFTGDSDSSDSADITKTLSVPVRLRNVNIGQLRIRSPQEGHEWSEDEITIAGAVAERVALAVENARLIIESQKRAAKEQVIGEISTEIGSTIDLDNILQTTLREIGRILPGAEISIQMETEKK